jgi:hypothetical protein
MFYYQIGTGGAAPVIPRVMRGLPPAPEMHIEGGPFDAAGLVRFILDGRDRGGGPAAPGRTGTVGTIVLEPDDITLGLSRQMKQAASLSIEVPASRGTETIEFDLDGYGTALERVQQSADPVLGPAPLAVRVQSLRRARLNSSDRPECLGLLSFAP